MAQAALAFSRLVWDEIYIKDYGELAESARPYIGKRGLVRVPSALARALLAQVRGQPGVSEAAGAQLEAWLRTRQLLGRDGEGEYFRLLLFRPSLLLSSSFDKSHPDFARLRADAEYLLWRSVRQRHFCLYSSLAVQAFNALSAEMNRAPRGWRAISADLQKPLEQALRADPALASNAERWVSLFLECCRIVGYIEPRYGLGKVVVQTGAFDVDFLLAKLFGFPTQIMGFDGLFGGGGIVLAERLGDKYTTRGRIILMRGQFGAGKSSLALALAAEVARKPGGLSWVVPLEQTPDECRQCLQATAAPGYSAPVVLDDVDAVMRDVKPDLDASATAQGLHAIAETDEKGLVILSSPKSDIGRMLERIAVHAQETQRYPLRLWVVDPINSIVGFEGGGAALRVQLVQILRKIKDLGANLILVAEADGTEQAGVEMLANVADVVIDLTTELRHGYSQRFLEVKKSRLQREQRGQHPFSIKQRSGISVLLSSPAVRAKTSARRIKQRPQTPRFAWDDLDEQLGAEGLCIDDVVVVRGDEGTPRAQVGHLFLLGSNHIERDSSDERTSSSLLVSFEPDEHVMQRQLDLRSMHAQRHRSRTPAPLKSDDQVEFLALSAGFIQPGTVFQLLEEKIESLQRQGRPVDRLVFDRVQQLEFGCPFIGDDETFGSTLVDFLRRRHISALFVCGPEGSYEGRFLQKALENEAGVLINLERTEYRNSQRVTLEIVKTRSMRHSREKFDLDFSGDALALHPSLVRGERVVDTTLYLHTENQLHDVYHQQIKSALQGILARKAEVKSEDRTRLAGMAELAAVSAIDELQIWQVDEFHLPRLLGDVHNRRLLHRFPASRWTWAPSDKSRVEVHSSGDKNGPKDFAAVPFYNNVSMLALHRDCGLSDSEAQSWDEIAKRCWARSNRGEAAEPSRPFFDCPLETDEDYNCLFIEVLLGTGLARSELMSDFGWLEKPSVVHALALFRVLCHDPQAWRDSQPRPASNREPCRPLVARHWYTTFCDFSNRLGPREHLEYRLVPLPTRAEQGSVAISGEWYLAVPIFSVAPLLGLEIIRALTTREEELERMRLGVGLPVSSEFYTPGDGVLSERLPRMKAVDLQLFHKLSSDAFRRSQVKEYARLSPILASHLRYVARMDLPPVPPEQWDAETLAPLRKVQDSLSKSVRFSRSAPPR